VQHFDVSEFLVSFAKLLKALLALSCLSVRMEQLGSHWTDFRKIWFECFPKISSRRFKFC